MNASVEELGGADPIVRSVADARALGMAFILRVDPDGARQFVFAGPRCLGVNGVDGAAAMDDASLVFDRILPEHRAAFDAAEAQARAAGDAFDIEVAMLAADEAVRWRRFSALPRPQPDGGMIWDGMEIDVTDQRRMAGELLEQRKRLEMAVETTGLGFWEWEIAARKVTWSERNRALYGLGPDDPVTVERYLELVHEDDREAVRTAFISARDAIGGGDYSIEHRAVTPAGETRWILAHGRVSHDAGGEARLVVGTSLDITERKAAEERRALLMGELAHRAKNGIAVLMAIVSQTARGQETVEGFLEAIMARLKAMADSQDLVTASGGQPVALGDVFGKALAPFGRARVDLDPEVAELTVRGDMAIGMGLLLHEMATNAVKYGALSIPGGRVRVGLEPAPEGRLAFSWREIDGPPVARPSKPGFGARLLQQVLRPQGGEVTSDFAPDGFHARIELPTVRQ